MLRDQNVIDDNVKLLEQALPLLNKLDKDIYCLRDPQLHNDAIGVHLRHVLDFYHCFFKGYPLGRINYDDRRSDCRMETDMDYAKKQFSETLQRLENLKEDQLNKPVLVLINAANWEEGNDEWSQSTVKRELQSVLSHTVHHFALIALVLHAHNVAIDDHFGIAPSTLAYRQRMAYVHSNLGA